MEGKEAESEAKKNLLKNIFLNLKAWGIQEIDTNKILPAFEKIDRKEFVPDEFDSEAYIDYPLYIGKGQTISQPSTVAFMTALLDFEKWNNVLEIGTGSGYSSAITFSLIKPGKLTTMEIIPELHQKALGNLKKYFAEDLGKTLIPVLENGANGFEKNAPYDRIYFTAGIQGEFDFSVIEKQLGKNAVILIPQQQGALILRKYQNGKLFSEKKYGGFAFVPLK
jgi:protein-L-isoaspartate(D-aspartate) O-methyltransferase